MNFIGPAVLMAVGIGALAALKLHGASRQREKLPAVARVDLDRLMAAIAQVETGNDQTKIGPEGERSAWQMTRAVWSEHTAMTFSAATSDPVLARRIVWWHFLKLQRELWKKEEAATVGQLAAAWHYGPQNAGLLAKTDYCERVENLYRDSGRAGQ